MKNIVHPHWMSVNMGFHERFNARIVLGITLNPTGEIEMAGYFTPGMETGHGDVLSGDSRIPADTNLSGGTSPQSVGIIPGTLPAPSSQLGLVALAGGGKTGATQLGYGVNTLATVATAANSVMLPYAFPGAVVFLVNSGAQTAQVFGRGTDVVDGIATATGADTDAAERVWFIGITGAGDGSDAGSWLSLAGVAT
jgi:hypothetical protein